MGNRFDMTLSWLSRFDPVFALVLVRRSKAALTILSTMRILISQLKFLPGLLRVRESGRHGQARSSQAFVSRVG